MKIRSGFVSNSSSSSFIIEKCEYFKNIQELAKYMIGRVEYNDNKQSLYDLLDNTDKDVNTNIKFNSCNYNTYIYDYGNYMLVDTCNNEDWELWDYHTSENVFLKLHTDLDPNGYGEIYFDVFSGTQIWDIERNHMFKETKKTYILQTRKML